MVDEVANVHPPLTLTVSQPLPVLPHLASPLTVCPLLRVLQINLDGSHCEDSTITSGVLKDE